VTARLLGRVLVVVVLVASGAYFLVYLYRWQWNRALVSGLFFVAAEIAVVASVVLRRLSSIEQRLDEVRSRPPAEPPPALGPIAASAPPPRDRFEWLGQSRTSVFLPILLGAGVLLSGVATVVERIAGATARPVLERRLALRLQPLALPSGGLPGVAATAALPVPRRAVLVGRVVAAAVAALLLWGAVDAIADATQTRPEPELRGMTTDLELSVRHREAGGSVEATADELFAACRATFQRTLSGSVRELGGGRVLLGVTPGLGPQAQRRMEGCLEDLTFDGVLGGVVSSTTRRASAPG
jgi:hypothetical protein